MIAPARHFTPRRLTAPLIIGATLLLSGFSATPGQTVGQTAGQTAGQSAGWAQNPPDAPTSSTMPPANGDVTTPEIVEEVEPPPRWRFRDPDRPIKVVVLAGSIGARPRGSYSEQLESMCSRVEIENLSKTGFGAGQLADRFQERVLENRYADLNNEAWQYWLIFGGGLNSVGEPERSIHYMRRLFQKAHARGFRVLGLTLTPWGDDSDERRWAGSAGLRYLDYTQKIVDFTMGRLTPQVALGNYSKQRHQLDPDRFHPEEIPDLSVDLFDSDLRQNDAPLRPLERMRKQVARDRYWRRSHADLTDEARSQQLEADAVRATEIPQWYLRREFHSFDAIHPNGKGHRRMAELICPALPQDWGCDCSYQDPQLIPNDSKTSRARRGHRSTSKNASPQNGHE